MLYFQFRTFKSVPSIQTILVLFLIKGHYINTHMIVLLNLLCNSPSYFFRIDIMKCCLWIFIISCGILLRLMFQIVVPNVTKKDFCCRVHYHHPFIPCKWPFPLRVVVGVSQQYQNRVMEFKKRQKLCMLTSKYIIYPCFCHYDNTKVI